MIDLNKLKYLKLVGYLLLVVLALVVGVGIGQSMSGNKVKTTKSKSEQTTTKQVLSSKEVEDFLLNYFTKKDLGENRKRYKSFMTDGLYQQEVAKEDESVSQTYKGFVVDFKFKSAAIFVDQENLQVLTQVNYVNTLLDEKKNYETAQKDVLNKVTLRLTYIKDVDGKLKVNKIESIILTDQTGNYGTLDRTTTVEEQPKTTSSEPQTTKLETEKETKNGH